MRTLKLIGAATFCSYAAGMKAPVKKGGTEVFEDDVADIMLTRVYLDSANNPHPVWTEELDAKVVHEPAAKQVSLEDAVKPPKEAKPAPKKKAARKRTAKAT